MICARLFSVEEIGLATTIISVMGLIVGFSILGLNIGFSVLGLNIGLIRISTKKIF